ncbi:MAG: hypothetical protein QCH35_08485 [Methanomicrobiaceae archaeon]|nr:hypothetical protein [Methanomicrobiaceae archaeon]
MKGCDAEYEFRFNKAVNYEGQDCAWSYLIILKTRELAHSLTAKKNTLVFCAPEYAIDRSDSEEIRKKILAIPYKEWKEMRFSKGTLHYMKKNAEIGQPFFLNKPTSLAGRSFFIAIDKIRLGN